MGKQGITDNFIKTLESHFKKYKVMKISVLKGAGHERGQVKEYANEIVSKISGKFNAKVIGFTIIVKRGKSRDLKGQAL